MNVQIKLCHMFIDVVLTSSTMQSVPITTKSSHPTHGEVYLIQYWMMKFVSDLGQVGGFL